MNLAAVMAWAAVMTWGAAMALDAVDYARFPRFFFFYCPRRLYLTRVFTDSSFSTALARAGLRAFSAFSLFLLPPVAIDYARFPLFLFFYCPCTRCTTRVFTDFSFSTALARAGLRAFSAFSLFLLPLLALDYARFPLFLFFYCPCTRWTTRVFHCFSFSTALARARLRAFSAVSLFLLPRRRYLTRVFHCFSFSTAPRACILRAFSLILLFLLPRRLYPTRVFRYSSFSTALARAGLRAFSLISLFLLPLHALDYARFPEILVSHGAQFIHYRTPLFNQPVQAACCICRAGARQFDG